MQNAYSKKSGRSLAIVLLIVVGHYDLVADSGKEDQWGTFQAIPAVSSPGLAWQRYPIEGFAWPMSVKPGDAIKFYVSVMNRSGQSYHIQIFRSLNGTIMWDSTNLAGRFYPLHDSTGAAIDLGVYSRKPVDFKSGCMTIWDSTSVPFTIPTSWQSGLYYAKLTHLSISDPDSVYDVPFIVRAASPGSTSKILFKMDFNTLQAYNYWGGGDLYSSGQDTTGSLTPTDTIAMDRPFRLDISHWTSYYDKYFAQVLQDSGYTMEYCDNIDLDSSGVGVGLDLLSNYKTLVIYYHDEYWSFNERKVIDDTTNGFYTKYHGNLARFAQNTCYWQIHWVGGVGAGYSKLYCQKDNVPWRTVPTDRWRVIDPNNPEAKFLGSQYETGLNDINADPLTEEPPDVVYEPSHWIFRGTQLAVSDTFGYGVPRTYGLGHRSGILATEEDNTLTGRASFPIDILAQRYVYSRVDSTNQTYRYVLHQMIYYEDTTNNSRIFAAGAGGWSFGLDPGADHPTDVSRMKQITINLISHFSGKKYVGKVYTGAQLPLEWKSNIELDGAVQVPLGKYLKVTSATITVDSTFLIDGTFEISGATTIAGNGILQVDATGQIIVDANSTLTLGGTLEVNGVATVTGYGILQVAPTGRIIVDANSTLTLDTTSTLRAQGGSSFVFGSGASLIANGPVAAQGSSGSRITFSSNIPNPGINSWNGITLNGGPDTLTYCKIQYAQYGINVQNTSTNFLDHDTVNTSYGGILGWNTSTSQGALTVHYCDLSTNNRGIALSNANADILQSRMQANNWQGLYAINATFFLKNSRIQGNGLHGMYLSGSTTTGTFSDRKEGPGFNTVYNNDSSRATNMSEITLASGSVANIGDAGTSAWGYNNIYHGSTVSPGELLIDNEGTETTLANLVYWGDPPYPSSSDFNGAVDYSSYLTSPVTTPAGKISRRAPQFTISSTSTTTLDSSNLSAWATRLKDSVSQGTMNSVRDLHTLAVLVGPGGVLSDALVGGWENFLSSLIQSTQLLRLRELSNAYLVQARFARFDYNGVLTLTSDILTQNPGDNLWLYCQVSQILAQLARNDVNDASTVLNTLKANPQKADGNTVALMQELINLKKGLGPTAKVASRAVAGNQSSDVPISFALYQNYPNPFNPTTIVQYDLPEEAHVRLTLYDILGREVARLIDGVVPAGYHRAEINASNIASGVYFYRLEASATSGRTAFNSLKKMLVLK